jgi:hypothetical protein
MTAELGTDRSQPPESAGVSRFRRRGEGGRGICEVEAAANKEVEAPAEPLGFTGLPWVSAQRELRPPEGRGWREQQPCDVAARQRRQTA